MIPRSGCVWALPLVICLVAVSLAVAIAHIDTSSTASNALRDCYPLSEGRTDSANAPRSSVKVRMELLESSTTPQPIDKAKTHTRQYGAADVPRGSSGSISRGPKSLEQHLSRAPAVNATRAPFAVHSLAAFKIVEGDESKAVECCTLSPFDSVCTKPGDKEGTVQVSTTVEQLPSSAAMLVTSVPAPSVVLTPEQPTQIVNTTVGSTNYLGAYTLITWPLTQLVHASFYVTRELDGVKTRCEFIQLVGNVGNAVQFADNDCTKLCSNEGNCSVFEYCGKPIPRTDGQYSFWFSIRIKERYYDMGYVTTSDDGAITYTFSVKIYNDCLNPYPRNSPPPVASTADSEQAGTPPGGRFVDTQYSTSGSVSVYANPADGTVDLILRDVYFGYLNHAWLVAKAVLHMH